MNEYLESQFALFRQENELSCSPGLDCWNPDESSQLKHLFIYGRRDFVSIRQSGENLSCHLGD